MRNTIAIVGAGFSGTVLAAQLLRHPPATPTDLVLVERGPEMGRGVAYAARDYPYLLNVPAGRLSVDASDPLQFLRFAQRHLPDAGVEDFMPRALYGDYLCEVLAQAEREAPTHIRLQRIFDEARRISSSSGDKRLVVEFASRPALPADRVILAVGNLPPPMPAWAGAIRDHRAYRHDPWELPRELTQHHAVLIVGSGLTMADVALRLTEDASRAPALHTISRRGLVPLPQTEFRTGVVRIDSAAMLAHVDSLRRLVAMTRELTRQCEHGGGDWREVITVIRHEVPALWSRLPLAERRRFVRHMQPHWDVHRHRLPPQLSARIDALRSSGALRVNAGRIDAVTAAEERLHVTWRPRGNGSTETLIVDSLVNATGAGRGLKQSTDPLLSALASEGMICEDPLDIGLRTSRHGACVDAQGVPSERLFYLGPMLRADHWEATAAAELRDHARELAAHLVDRAAAERPAS
jgi:uncharacterized NAD(P)/FAD-binding protein YdhS